jgi:hypothetical protein
MKELYAALAAAQGEFAAIPRNKTVQVRMKSGGAYTFAYAPLETILAAVRPSLAKHGLAVTQTIRDSVVETVIGHASGESVVLAPVAFAPVDASPQALGSALTYARRYSITLALCIASDDDDDGGAAAGNETVPVERPIKADPAILTAARKTAERGSDAFRKSWADYSQVTRLQLREHLTELQAIAKEADTRLMHENDQKKTQHDDRA